MPGASWLIKVEFRPLSRGFSVWVYEDNLMVDQPRWHKAGGDSRPLNWHTAGAYLAKDETLRVFGDFWGSVEIDGIPRWAADVLGCLFIEDEDAAYDYRAIGELLIGLNDKEAKPLLGKIGPILVDTEKDDAPAELLALADLSKFTRSLGLNGQSLLQIKFGLGLDNDATLEEVAVASEQMYAHRHVAKLLSETPHEQAHVSAPIADSKEGSAAHSVDDVGREYWKELSRDALPEDISQRILLVDRWLSEPKKPVGGGPSSGIQQSTSAWPILKWMLGKEEHIRSLLGRFAVERPVHAANLVREVMKRGKSEAYYFEGPNRFSGWAMNVMGRPIMRSNVQFALTVQSIADHFKIPIDEKHRIGELPFLK